MAVVQKSDFERAKVDLDKLHDVIHGDAFTEVSTDNGNVRSMANAIRSMLAYNPRGDWATATAYALKDIVLEEYPGASKMTYICVEAHTSSALFSTDFSAGKWAPLFVPPESGLVTIAAGVKEQVVNISPQADANYVPDCIAEPLSTGEVIPVVAVKNVTTSAFTVVLGGIVPSGDSVQVRWKVAR